MDHYVGNTEAGLMEASKLARTVASLVPSTIFPHEGQIEIQGDKLILSGWTTLDRQEIKHVDLRFTEAFGRWQTGGIGAEGVNLSFLFNGEPLILDLQNGERYYLLVNRNALTGMNGNHRWHKLLTEWLTKAE